MPAKTRQHENLFPICFYCFIRFFRSTAEIAVYNFFRNGAAAK